MNPWIEALRLRTLPVSAAGVLTGAGCAAYIGGFRWLPFCLCLLFALLAQIVSNLANEYFDFKNGLDRKGREGFRRGVTEGDISASAMLRAVILTLILACIVGCCLIFWGGWWLMLIGLAVAVFALAYSAGPYPLSHHGLGDIAVLIFFGIIPVCLTSWLSSGSTDLLWQLTFPLSVAIGLMGVNVLIVNNYRDIDDDRAVNKRTTAVIFGPSAIRTLYFINGIIAIGIILWVTIGRASLIWQAGSLLYANIHFILWTKIKYSLGSQLNPILGKTAMLLFGVSLWLLLLLSLN